jgi:hypothetical protein
MPQRLKLADGWIPYSVPSSNRDQIYRQPSWARRDTLCVLSGWMRPEVPGDIRQNMTIVPAECRPDKRLVFYVPGTLSAQRVDVRALGRAVPNSLTRSLSTGPAGRHGPVHRERRRGAAAVGQP